jgi:hypothetical protein
MRRFTILAALALAAAALSVSIAWAGNPHFVSVTVTREGNSLLVEGKEAGLGNETRVHIEVRATAECINPGSHHPKAENKEDVSAEGEFPVQNGKADFSLTLTAEISPNCSPPMTIRWSNVEVEDTEHEVLKRVPGTF